MSFLPFQSQNLNPRCCIHCQSTCFGHRTSTLQPSQPSPDIARLLTTNDPPSATQEDYLLQFRVDGSQRLTELETIIGELQQTLEGATAERDTLTGNLERHWLVFHPVRRLPADVLREIFLFACTRTAKEPFHFCLIPPTFLTAVCRSWHHIAVTFPQLRRQFKVFMHKGQSFMDSDMVAYSLSVSRSAMCPLWLDLLLDVQTLSYSNRVFPFLLCISGRIQRLRVSMRDLRLLEGPEFRCFANSLNALVHLELFIKNNDFATISLPRTIQHLVITAFDACSEPEVDFNWSRLQSLVLQRHEDTTARSVRVILAKARNLRSLTFSNDEDDHYKRYESAPVTVDSMITIPPLTELVVESSTPSNFVYDVLANFSTPSLTRLVIKGVLATYIGFSVGKKVRRCVDNVDAIDSLIRRCGSLRELSLLDIRPDAQFVTRLLASLESLSQLRILAIDISYVDDLSFSTQEEVADDVLTFLESRRNLNHTPNSDIDAPSRVYLESFTLHAPSEDVLSFTDVQRQRIEALRASGLLLYVCRYAENDPRKY